MKTEHEYPAMTNQESLNERGRTGRTLPGRTTVPFPAPALHARPERPAEWFFRLTIRWRLTGTPPSGTAGRRGTRNAGRWGGLCVPIGRMSLSFLCHSPALAPVSLRVMPPFLSVPGRSTSRDSGNHYPALCVFNEQKPRRSLSFRAALRQSLGCDPSVDDGCPAPLPYGRKERCATAHGEDCPTRARRREPGTRTEGVGGQVPQPSGGRP